MRLKNIPGAREYAQAHPRVITQLPPSPLNWGELFGNERPLRLEIGMGKGRFLLEMSQKYPLFNFVGIERYESVMIKALRRLDSMDAPPANLFFIRGDALNVGAYFHKRSVERIYLNFSDPWPKNRHAHRRLVSISFLSLFRPLLQEEGQIEFKTDNESLFDFGLSEASEAGWNLKYVSRDLHSDPEGMSENVMTEYEEKFSGRGQKILKFIITPPL